MKSDVTEEMRTQLLQLLGYPQDRAGLEFLLQSAADKVKQYCRQRKLDGALRRIVVEIAFNRARHLHPGSAEAPQEVASIKDGDQTISYHTSATGEKVIPSTGLTEGEMLSLNAYRKAWWD